MLKYIFYERVWILLMQTYMYTHYSWLKSAKPSQVIGVRSAQRLRSMKLGTLSFKCMSLHKSLQQLSSFSHKRPAFEQHRVAASVAYKV